MSYSKVEDPNLIAMLNKQSLKKVTDPNILRQLNEEQTFQEPPEESFLSKLPRNILAGLASMGHSTINAPHDIAQSLENSGQDIGQVFDKSFPLPKEFQEELEKLQKNKPFKLSEHIPHQQEYNFAQLLGQPGEGTLMDNLIQKGVEYSPYISGIGSALTKLPITKYPGTKALNQLRNLIEERGIDELRVPEHIFQDIERNKFLRNTRPNKNLLEQARLGGYKDLFNLQSDLGKIERDYTRDLFSAANRQFGRDVGTNRQELLTAMKDALSNLGHEDLAELLSHGQNKYRQYMKFRPYRNAALGLAAGSIPGYSIVKKFMF